MNPPHSRSNLVGLVILLVAGLLLAAAVFFYDPARHSFYPQCVLYRTTGLLCPGCGSLRAVHHLLHGEIASALRLNGLLVLAVPVIVILVVRAWFIARSDRGRARVPAWVLWAALAATLAFGILRNTPLAQALGLMP